MDSTVINKQKFINFNTRTKCDKIKSKATEQYVQKQFSESSADFTGCDWILTDDEIRVVLC